MRPITSRPHAVLDYLMGLLLIVSPWLFDFHDVDTAKWIMVVLGLGTILYGLITHDEFAAARIIPLRTHLAIDATAGGLLAICPWVFGFDEFVFWPFVLLGMTEFVIANLTHPAPETAARVTPRRQPDTAHAAASPNAASSPHADQRTAP